MSRKRAVEDRILFIQLFVYGPLKLQSEFVMVVVIVIEFAAWVRTELVAYENKLQKYLLYRKNNVTSHVLIKIPGITPCIERRC
jgi:hypothetical protein